MEPLPLGLARSEILLDIVRHLNYTKFATLDEGTKILLTGAPDAVFQVTDGSILIADYKTAKFTPAQDRLLPTYRAQLNAYAAISERIGYGHVSRLALIYTEPVTDSAAAAADEAHRVGGFDMGFSAHIVPVDLDLGMIQALLESARTILDLPVPPAGRTGCKDCSKLESLVGLITAGSRSG